MDHWGKRRVGRKEGVAGGKEVGSGRESWRTAWERGLSLRLRPWHLLSLIPRPFPWPVFHSFQYFIASYWKRYGGNGLGTRLAFAINPLTTEFFPPRQHIFMHSAHTTFVGTPLPQHSLLSSQTWWGPHTWRDPSGNTVNDIHDPPQAQQSEVKGGCQLDFRPAFP